MRLPCNPGGFTCSVSNASTDLRHLSEKCIITSVQNDFTFKILTENKSIKMLLP